MALETLQPGTLLGGRYKLGPLIGHGGMGSVYEAIQVDLGRRVAVKVLDPRLALDPAHVERFRREAHAAAQLGHPNIVQVTDFSWQPGTPPFLVMEHLVGSSLAKAMERGPLAGRHVAVIASQALDALGAAHRAGIVHRDIKPDNLFLVQVQALGEVVKLLDFGIAKLVEGAQQGQPITSTGAMLGTPAYMAPEQARGGAIDHRADLYGLGACMYHALTGRLPFLAQTAPAMLFAIVEQTPTPLAQLRPDLPPGLVGIVERAMAKDPSARFASADEMRAALAPYAAGPTLAPPSMPRSDGREAHAPTQVAPPAFTPASGVGGPVSPMAMASFGGSAHPSASPSQQPQFSVPSGVPVVMGQPTLGGVSNPTPAPPTPPPAASPSRAPLVIGGILGVLVLGLVVFGGVSYWLKKKNEADATPIASATSTTSTALGAAPTGDDAGAAIGSGPSTTASRWVPPSATAPVALGAPPPGKVDAKGNPVPTASVASNAAAANGPPHSAPLDMNPPLGPAPNAGPYPMSGKRVNTGGSEGSLCPGCDPTAWRTKVTNPPTITAINACYAEAQWEPPVHEDRGYWVRFDATGRVTDVLRNSSYPPIPRLDACIARVLRGVPAPMTKPEGGDIEIHFGAECDPGWHDHCKALAPDAGAAAPKPAN